MRRNGQRRFGGSRAMDSYDAIMAAVLFVIVFWTVLTIAVFYHTGVY